MTRSGIAGSLKQDSLQKLVTSHADHSVDIVFTPVFVQSRTIQKRFPCKDKEQSPGVP